MYLFLLSFLFAFNMDELFIQIIALCNVDYWLIGGADLDIQLWGRKSGDRLGSGALA